MLSGASWDLLVQRGAVSEGLQPGAGDVLQMCCAHGWVLWSCSSPRAAAPAASGVGLAVALEGDICLAVAGREEQEAVA